MPTADVSALRHASMVTVVRLFATATATAEDTTEVGTMAAVGKRLGGFGPPSFFFSHFPINSRRCAACAMREASSDIFETADYQST